MFKPALLQAARAGAVPWDPARTRAFIVGLCWFEGNDEPDWPVEERRDRAFAELLAARGVPLERIELLQDEHATLKGFKKRFKAMLEAAEPDDTLVFYLGSHGEYEADEQTHSFQLHDAFVDCAWVLDTIEARFGGKRALVFADCCYSGGIVEQVARREGRVAMAGLSSTAAHNAASGDWAFTDCLIRAFGGSPLVDLDGDGCITLAELARYAGRHMAFCSEGKPLFAANEGFGAMALAQTQGQIKDGRIGTYAEVLSDDEWFKAEVVDVMAGELKVHFVDYADEWDEWITPDRMRLHHVRHFPPGTAVEAFCNDLEEWLPARVLSSWESLHLVRFDDYDTVYDEWLGPSRLRAK